MRWLGVFVLAVAGAPCPALAQHHGRSHSHGRSQSHSRSYTPRSQSHHYSRAHTGIAATRHPITTPPTATSGRRIRAGPRGPIRRRG